MLIIACIALVVASCGVALRRAEAGPSAWRDAALVLVWGVWVCGALLVLGAFILLTLPTETERPLSVLEQASLPAQFLLATAGALCWWRVTTERSRSRYRRALAWLAAGLLCVAAWGAAIAVLS